MTCPFFPHSKHVTLRVGAFLWMISFFLSFIKNISNFLIRSSSSSVDSSSWFISWTFTLVFNTTSFESFTYISRCSNLSSSISCSWSFPNKEADVMVERLFFSDIIITFGCLSMVKDLITLRFNSSLVKVLPREIRWLVKWTNLFCRARIDSLGCILNNSYS